MSPPYDTHANRGQALYTCPYLEGYLQKANVIAGGDAAVADNADADTRANLTLRSDDDEEEDEPSEPEVSGANQPTLRVHAWKRFHAKENGK